MSLEPGVEETMLKTDGSDRIKRTQPPMRLDDLIGQLIYSGKRGESSSSAPASAEPAHP
jgi:ABC-type transporter Mla subunit MlaD